MLEDNIRKLDKRVSEAQNLAEEQKEMFLSAAEGAEGLQMQIVEVSVCSNYATTKTSNNNKAGQKAGSMIIKLSLTMSLHTLGEEKKQEGEMRTETGKLFKSVHQCESFSVANLKKKILTKLEATATQNGMAEEKQTAKKSIITLSMKPILATAARKQEMSITEKRTALFAEKIGVQNTQSPQGSVGIHCSASTYMYGRMKDIRYRSYVH
eukprot:6151804-Ditylum_brightwellii.AAC.1